MYGKVTCEEEFIIDRKDAGANPSGAGAAAAASGVNEAMRELKV